VNELQEWKGDKKSEGWKEAVKVLVLMLAPMAPYVSEELWKKIGGKFSVHEQKWPSYNEELARGEEVVVVVQVNGKLRSRLSFNREEAKNKQKVLQSVKKDEKVKGYIVGKKVVKEIFVPEKLVNLVVK